MRRTTQLQHDVVGDIDQGGNAALTRAFQTILHPLRRRGFSVESLDDTTGEAATQLRSFDVHRFDALASRFHSIELGHIERRTCDGVYISCYTDDRKRIAAVGRELDFKALVIKFGVFANIHADRSIRRQNPQALMVFVDAEFARRAQHAETFDAAHLSLLDLEVAGQHGANQSTRHFDAGLNIGSTTHNLQQFRCANVDLANMQMIRIFVINAVDDFGNHHAFKSRRNRRAIFDFKTGHGHGFGQLVARQIRIDDTAQPFFGKQHFFYLLTDYLNWRKKRRSPSKNRRKSSMP